MTRTRLLLPSLLASLALTLVACSDSESGDPSAITTSPQGGVTSAAEPAEDKADDAAPAGDGELTPLGTELALGEKAVVEYGEFAVGITVTAIDAGDKAAFEAEFGEQAKGTTPYFIRYVVENVDGSDLSSAPRLALTAADGGSTGSVVSGEMDGCERGYIPSDFAKGDTIELCILAGATDGIEATRVEYREDDYFDNPVFWKK